MSPNVPRRASYSPLLSLTSQQSLEPLIVVQESTCIDEEDETEEATSPNGETPDRDCLLNPGLLYPYREIRKRSLPTPHCTTGITASQVRRLSDQAGTTGTGAKEAAFLATLTQAPAPASGGRRHSVITISPAPPLLYGRNRRESIAAFPQSTQFRRDSNTSIARSPSGSITGSNFNLHRDIMDDIAEIKTPRKVRMKMWQTEDKEKVCEFQSVEGGGPASRYHQAIPGNSRDVPGPSRRYSDVSGIQAITQQQQAQSQATQRRRASEAPSNRVSTPPLPSSEIVISNTDLKTILSNLTSSAQEISNKMDNMAPVATAGGSKPSTLDQKRTLLKGSRSNSFDISMLPDGKKVEKEKSSWFQRRHLPMSNKTSASSTDVVVTITDEKPRTSILKHTKTIDKSSGVAEVLKKPSILKDKSVDKKDTPKHKVAWNKACNSMVDAHLLGSVIEGFLNKKTTETANTSGGGTGGAASGGESKGKKEETSKESKEETTSSSLVSTLKDLFVK